MSEIRDALEKAQSESAALSKQVAELQGKLNVANNVIATMGTARREELIRMICAYEQSSGSLDPEQVVRRMMVMQKWLDYLTTK